MGTEATNCNFLEKDMFFFPSNTDSLDWPIQAANPRCQFFKEVTFCCLINVTEEKESSYQGNQSIRNKKKYFCAPQQLSKATLQGKRHIYYIIQYIHTYDLFHGYL